MVSLRTFAVTSLMALGAIAVPLNARGSPNTWSIRVFLDGPVETFTGDIKDVWQEVLAENPNFETDFPDYKKLLVGMGYVNSGEIKRSINARGAEDTTPTTTSTTTATATATDAAETTSAEATTDASEVKTWAIQVFLYGKVENFVGDIISVFTKVLKMNPNFETDFPHYKSQLIELGYMTEEQAKEAEEAAKVSTDS
ncbi:hypothetical protein BROUX41_002982 [Berkeleyomyces rouxiae]|uniref:uncharacterized protein n=1 Tax=Berkeleyomyces rouxiae TaxID=2035830 RepID=UPI003B7CEA56